MKCPYCNTIDDKVIDSRISRTGEAIRRRRECLSCEKRFTTHERVEEMLPLIIKKDERREPYARHKILDGLKKACQKRPISIEVLEETADKIEQELMDRGAKEIKSSELGEKMMGVLHDLDAIAYVRFASVYRSFTDITDFMKEVKKVLPKKD